MCKPRFRSDFQSLEQPTSNVAGLRGHRALLIGPEQLVYDGRQRGFAVTRELLAQTSAKPIQSGTSMLGGINPPPSCTPGTNGSAANPKNFTWKANGRLAARAGRWMSIGEKFFPLAPGLSRKPPPSFFFEIKLLDVPGNTVIALDGGFWRVYFPYQSGQRHTNSATPYKSSATCSEVFSRTSRNIFALREVERLKWRPSN